MLVRATLLAAILICCTMPRAQAQQSPDEAALPAASDIYPPMPSAPGDDSAGDTVVVPIPGGGEVDAEGPAAVEPSRLPPSESWATQQNGPNSVGISPIGP